jgi:DNA-binding MarR family transcriptional regulator
MAEIDLDPKAPYTELLSVLVEIDAAVDSTEITMRALQALVLIARKPPLTYQPHQIKDILGIPKSAVTRMLQTLVGHRLIESKIPFLDLRRRMLTITPKGIALVQRIEKVVLEAGTKQ